MKKPIKELSQLSPSPLAFPIKYHPASYPFTIWSFVLLVRLFCRDTWPSSQCWRMVPRSSRKTWSYTGWLLQPLPAHSCRHNPRRGRLRLDSVSQPCLPYTRGRSTIQTCATNHMSFFVKIPIYLQTVQIIDERHRYFHDHSCSIRNWNKENKTTYVLRGTISGPQMLEMHNTTRLLNEDYNISSAVAKFVETVFLWGGATSSIVKSR